MGNSWHGKTGEHMTHKTRYKNPHVTGLHITVKLHVVNVCYQQAHPGPQENSQKMEHSWKKTKLEVFRISLKERSIAYREALKASRSANFSTLLEENKHNLWYLFETVAKLTKKKASSPEVFKQHSSNVFMNFFTYNVLCGVSFSLQAVVYFWFVLVDHLWLLVVKNGIALLRTQEEAHRLIEEETPSMICFGCTLLLLSNPWRSYDRKLFILYWK